MLTHTQLQSYNLNLPETPIGVDNRKRDSERQGERGKRRDRERQRESEKQRERQRDTEREKETERDRDTERERRHTFRFIIHNHLSESPLI